MLWLESKPRTRQQRLEKLRAGGQSVQNVFLGSKICIGMVQLYTASRLILA
jgi:hypothetical protein